MKGGALVRLGVIGGAIVLAAIVALTRSSPRVASPPAPSIELAPGSPATPALLSLADELEQRLVRLTNEHRTRVGLRPLNREAGLSTAARRHSEDMLRRRFFAHVNPDGQTPAERVAQIHLVTGNVGENIWMWSGASRRPSDALVAQAVAEWMASPPHRENILRPGYTRLGVGASTDATEVRLTELFMQ